MSFPRKLWSRLVFALLLATIGIGIPFSPAAQAQSQQQIILRQFDLLSSSTGWILLDQRIYWTSDGTQTWVEIGPTVQEGAAIADVKFIDTNLGWVLSTASNPDGSTNFQLAHTIDGGTTWADQPLNLFEEGEIGSYAEKPRMGWLDAVHGWILVKQSSGSNFSVGTLFTTSDGGENWQRFTAPVADNIYFSTPQIGWAFGGPTGDQTFRTRDGGATWEEITPVDIAETAQTVIHAPDISNPQNGLMLSSLGDNNILRIYALDDSSSMWLALGQIKLNGQPGLLSLANLGADSFVATIPGTASILHGMNGELELLNNKDGDSASVVEVDMISLEVGWAKSVDSKCVTASSPNPETNSIACSSTTRLLQTTDGGITWQVIDLPLGSSELSASNVQTATASSLSNLENTEVFVGQGFDRCQIPTLSQMQTWWNSSPYKTVNLYIGGSNRTCSNNVLISSYVFQLNQQGWKFIPTWVGPQAPCTGYPSRMSSDVTTAYNEGLLQANQAVDRLAELGLTGPSKTGSVVYYDIEYYGTNTACRASVNAFMNGWVAQLRSRGHYAGVYGSTLCNTGLSDFLNITNVPDVIWAARWYNSPGQGYYDPNASVWNLGSCIPDTAWSNNQRIRQYEGDHDETWGNLTLNIDSNVLDGVVAVPYDYPHVSKIVRKNANPTSAASVAFTVTFSKSVTGVNQADFALNTSGVTSTSISTVSGSGTTYTVNVSTGTGNGTIRLDVLDNDSIKDAAENPLGGAGTGNGNFTSGESYTVAKSINITGNVGIAEATLTYLNGTFNSVIADGSGNYSIIVPFGWTGTITPYKTGYTFAPANKYYSSLQSNQGNQDYTAQSCADCADVNVAIVGAISENYTIPSSGRVTPTYPGIQTGPVKVSSNVPVFASERALFGPYATFNEVMGFPDNQLTTRYWFPWYDNKDMSTWILIGNPDGNQTANVTIKIAGQTVYSQPLGPNGIATPQFPNVQNGPVEVLSNIPIFTSERALYGAASSFNEVMGFPNNQLTTRYWFPWYDNKDMKSWILVGNPSTTLTANVTIKIAGQTVYSQPLGPNGIATPTFGTIQNGPVEVISDIPIFTSERSLYGPYGTFNEVMGFPNNQLTTRYWFPWYDNKDMWNWVLVGNPSTNQTANVTIKIAGQTVYSEQLGPGAIVTPTFGTTQNGPVEVISDIPIFTSERALYGPASSFNEVMGFPNNQLTTDYWFTWYDGNDMSTWILVGKP